MKRIVVAVVLGCLVAALAVAQNVVSSVTGSATDSSGAAMIKIPCRLTEQNTGVVLNSLTGDDGSINFPSVQAGTYTLTIEAQGFKTFTMKDILVDANQARALGRITLTVGAVTESISVVAEATPVELSNAERSGTISQQQLENIALKGRDFFGALGLVAGVVDTSQSRDSTSSYSQDPIYINGGRDRSINFMIDGVYGHNASNGSVVTSPNPDAIVEMRVVTTPYNAEYGRMTSGVINVVTKSGSSEFHGAGYGFVRDDSLNANGFFNNKYGTPRPNYEYQIYGYNIGGPVYLPGHFNADKSKLFFFFSQEFNNLKQNPGFQYVNTPTALERAGDFSQSFNSAGQLITIKDPTTGLPLSGNQVPANLIDPVGQAILNYFPSSNYVSPDPLQKYNSNLRSGMSASEPRRNDVLRLDAAPTSKWNLYYRYLHNKDDSEWPWGQWYIGSNYMPNPNKATVGFRIPGTGHAAHATTTFSPTLINEANFGYTYHNMGSWYQDPASVDRSKMGDPPRMNAAATKDLLNIIPDFTFYGPNPNPINSYLGPNPWYYRDRMISFSDNLIKIAGKHTFRFGFNSENRWTHSANLGAKWRGAYNFNSDSSNPMDTGDGYSNALMGVFDQYQETNTLAHSLYRINTLEFYVQDTWHPTPRLTLDIGMRFYHLPPQAAQDPTAAGFNPALYNPANAPKLYLPYIQNGKYYAQDPANGSLFPSVLIGKFVPGSGDYANGSCIFGQCLPAGGYTAPALQYAPRLGFAYDVTGDGKTALRGGFGIFYDTIAGNAQNNALGNPPVTYTSTVYYGTIQSLNGASGALGPSYVSQPPVGQIPSSSTMSYSLELQRQVQGFVLDASYVGSLSRHLLGNQNINPIGLGSRFNPASKTAQGILLGDDFLRPYLGYGDIVVFAQNLTSNYNALQTSLARRFSRGLEFHVNYTFSKALGASSNDWSGVSPYFSPRSRDYGRLGQDRTHVLNSTLVYEIPKLGKKTGSRALGLVTDDWTLGVTLVHQSGAPSYAYQWGNIGTGGQDWTGSSGYEPLRADVVSNPEVSSRTFSQQFNTAAFVLPAKGTFGNSGMNILTGPAWTNFDTSISKRIPLGSEKRTLQFRGEFYNLLNHTEFNAMDTYANFNPSTGQQINPTFGSLSGANPARIIQLSVRVQF